MSSREEPRYVRFGKPPKYGRSYDRWTERYLRGISVYPGAMDGPGLFIIETSALEGGMGLAALLAVAAQDRPAFFAEGSEVGVGPDGEPLLKAARFWPVPAATKLASTESYAERALGAWNEGPRDGSGFYKVYSRLCTPKGRARYMPDGVKTEGDLSRLVSRARAGAKAK